MAKWLYNSKACYISFLIVSYALEKYFFVFPCSSGMVLLFLIILFMQNYVMIHKCSLQRAYGKETSLSSGSSQSTPIMVAQMQFFEPTHFPLT